MAAYTNAKQVIPALFDEIMLNHKEIGILLANNPIPFGAAVELLRKQRDYRRAAEKMLHWNVDKGNG